MKLKNPKDFWSGVMFAVTGFAFAIIVKAFEYPMGTSGRMGPGYFPFVLGLLLGILGLAIVVEAIMTSGTPIAKFEWRALFWVLGAFVVFGLTATTLGILASIMLLVILSTYGGKKVDWLELVSIVPIIAIVLALGYGWQLLVMKLELPSMIDKAAVTLGFGAEWLTTILNVVGAFISTVLVTGGVALFGAVIYIAAKKKNFWVSHAEAVLSAAILASASWAMFVVGLKLPFPVWPVWSA